MNKEGLSDQGKIDSVKYFLEEKLEFDKFFKTYEMMYEAMTNHHDGISRKSIEKLLGKNNMMYVQVIIKVIIMEMELND